MKCAFRKNAFGIFKNCFKSYNNNNYFIIILLTLVKYAPLRFFVCNSFSCKSYNLKFLLILFLCFETFFGKFSYSKAYENKCQKRPRKANICQKVSQSKKSMSRCQFFRLGSFILSCFKNLKIFKLIAFMVLDRFLGGLI